MATGIPAGMPEWCGIGKGAPRAGECIDPSQC
jgi:hypothetical protein